MIKKHPNSILNLGILFFLMIISYHNTVHANAKTEITVLENELVYSYGFDNESSKFLVGDLLKVKATTKRWLVFTNFHGTTKLNTQNSYIQGTRTLSWANPLEYARYLFTNLSDSHNYSALLLDWAVRPDANSKDHHFYRDHVTFMIVPPQKEVEFLIGFAAPQAGKDERAGGGVQLRLKNLPIGTILVQAPLIFGRSKSMNNSKEYKKFDFEATYDSAMNALENYLDSPNAKNLSIPQSVFTPEHKVYAASAEFFDIEGISLQEINYSADLIKKFDVKRYVADKFYITNIEEIHNN